ncbi:A disintegrin and metalloproteinase with thrombospondin motifs 8-like isoform X1 [Stegostoma tigrinum]|uniref:A disintegrin and metalloproteinase with thrombospondin motifs 8-like isoform X1 n=1 Tax=Stegostoma tigrinum TaxID=3053191 RepID=UPI00202B0C5E|nr:A disintegrin and metalloproteinase with thrombospondin motifs 8-like isoform X1 [Stegostoma tigrinum]
MEMFCRVTRLFRTLPFLLCCLSLAQGGAEPLRQEMVTPVQLGNQPESPVYQLRAFGREFTLRLVPDSSILSPTFRLEHLPVEEPGYAQPRVDAVELGRCFYSGRVNAQPGSEVALSLCQGLRGSFHTDGEEYQIEPVEPGDGGAERPHLLRWRSAAAEGKPCAAPDIPGHRNRTVAARGKRFVSEARYIETMLVADSSMLHFHGAALQHYLLSLMAVVSRLYRHPSLRNLVSLVVVKLLVLHSPSDGPAVSSNAGLTLRNFCSWQRDYNQPSDRHPQHYDTAILFTRQDICGHLNCDTLGVADTGTMCDRSRSCAVIEDDGLQTAYTVAHELGHELSMPHDDSKTCDKLFGQIGKNHVMAPLFIRLNRTLPWSPCSAFHITEFFDNGHGDCLLDAPVDSVPLPTELPGQAYNLNTQCQQIFGENCQHCPNTSESDVCSQLWCRCENQTECLTRNGSLLWGDGTPCGQNNICIDGMCIGKDEVASMKQNVVEGSWGSWTPWGECSRTCGGGVQFSFRECNDPVPQNGGKYCEGQRTRYRSCNTEDCPNKNGKSFREEQCEKYNSWNYQDLIGNTVKWIPKYSGVSPRDRCKLFCRGRGRSDFKVFESKVIDGTSCGPDTTSICVQGQCVKAGCDHIIGSSKKFDKCAVCGGNSSTCRKISGSLNKSKYGYNDIVTIPAGATNIDVKQRSHKGIKHDGHYLAVKLLDDKYILNGDYSVITVEQDIPIGGAILKYSGSSTTLERIQSFKQLQEPLIIQLLSISIDTLPPRVKYSFFIPKDVLFSKQKAKTNKKSPNAIKQSIASQYTLGEWSECSRTCGSGWQRRNVECKDHDGNVSLECNWALKPEDIRPCADTPCPLWQLGSWSSCSRTCGKGERKRTALCVEYTGKTAEDDKCDLSKKPKSATEECFLQEC